MRVALGIAYRGSAYSGWQSQPGGRTVQDQLDAALSTFVGAPIRSICAGRTDAGVHALNQVVHFDTGADRERQSWIRGINRYLPADIAVQWCRFVPDSFHSRASAIGRRYVYVLLESPVRPALETGLAGWSFRPLDGDAMRAGRAAPCSASTTSAPSDRPSARRCRRSRRCARWRSSAAARTGASASTPTPSCIT